jgi:phosphate transport system permease protein
VLVFLIVLLLGIQAWPAIRTLGVSIVIGTEWKPNQGNILGGLSFIYGSVVSSLLAMGLAVPLGVGTAVFLSEIATGGWIKRIGSFLVELLAAIPSVVYGFWGINVLAPEIQKVFSLFGAPNVGGKSILTAGIILSVMIVPYIAAVSFDVCQAVPRAQREGSLALGATRWQTIWKVVLPYARPGIVGGCFLALGRAIGETMAVTMLIGNRAVIQSLPFGQGATIPSVLAQELPAPSSEMHRSALIELALLLFVVTILLNILARVLIWRVGRTNRGPSPLLGWLRRARKGPEPAEQPPVADAPRSAPEPSGPPRQPLPSNTVWSGRINSLMTGVLGSALVLTCGPLFLILGYIGVQGITALDLDFFLLTPRPQGLPDEVYRGGLANALVGSFIIVGLATLLAVPLGLLAAIFLAEYRTSRLVPVVRFFGELLNGVPSIIIGTFVFALVQTIIQLGWLDPVRQFSGWAGVLALAVMMIPIVMRASEEAMKLVPQTLRHASYALGAHSWQTVLRVTVPAALPAIITGTFLAIARIAGETAPLLLTIFGRERLVFSPSEPMGALPLYIYNYSRSGYPPWEEKAWAAALVLMTFIMALNIGVRVLTGKRVVQAGRAG